MNGPVLRVAWYRFRTTFRHRWSGYLALAVLIGLVGGVALGSLTAARRTYASYPNFLASTNPSDLLVLPQTNGPEPGLVHELARLPHVRSAEAGEQITAATLTPGRPDQHRPDNPGGADRQPGRAVLRPGPAEDHPGPGGQPGAGRRGRGHERGRCRPRPARGITHPGRDPAGQRYEPAVYRKTDLTVVGIGVLGIQLVHDDIDTNRAGFLVGTPALLREYESCCATNSYDGLQLDGGSRSDVPVVQEYEQLIDNPATGYGQLVVYDTSAIEAEAQQAIRPEAIALAVFGVIALVAALVIGTQSISRQLYAGAGQAEVLRALGAAPAATMADGLLGVVGAAVAGSLLAAAVAVSLSPLSLFGPVRQVEPAPGIDVDWTVLGPGMLVLTLVLGLVAAAVAYRLAPHRAARRVRAAGRGSGVVAAALAAGLPASGGRACDSPWSKAAAGPPSRSGRSWPGRCWPWPWASPR